MIVTLVASLVLAAQPQSEGTRMSLTPTTAENAVEAFADACMANFPDSVRFQKAIGRSASGYTPVQGASQWRTDQVVVSYVANGDGVSPQCSVDVLLDQTPDQDRLIGMVQGSVRRFLGLSPQAMRSGQMVVWSWQEDDRTQRVILDLGASGNARQLSLSVQRLK